jgi:hypothetical protein
MGDEQHDVRLHLTDGGPGGRKNIAEGAKRDRA